MDRPAVGTEVPGSAVSPIRLDRLGVGEVVRAAAIGIILVIAVTRRLGPAGLGAVARYLTSTTVGRAVARPAVEPAGHAARSTRTGVPSWPRLASDGLVDGFERLGPTFVKLGQLVASSPGVFPAPLAAACERCLYGVAPIPAADARRVVEEDLRAPITALFASFDDQPLAAASIAQVHACVLLDGREAVLKIQRPGIAAQMRRDLRIMYALARAAEHTALGRTANVKGAVEDLARVTARELDARLEATEQARFRAGIGAYGDNTMVTAPELYPQWCGPRVICMERMYGVPLDRIDRTTGIDTELLIRRVVKVWLEALAVHGPFHGDVHAGNVWLLDDGRVSFLDFGIVGELSAEWQTMFRDVFRTSVIDADYVRVVRAFKRVGVLPPEANDALLARVVESLFAPMLDRGLSEVGLGDVLRSLFTVLQQFGVGTPEELVLVTKQLVYFEGYSKVLAPAYVMARDPYLVRNLFPAEAAAKAAELGMTLPS